jgi:hypothetical protein
MYETKKGADLDFRLSNYTVRPQGIQNIVLDRLPSDRLKTENLIDLILPLTVIPTVLVIDFESLKLQL